MWTSDSLTTNSAVRYRLMGRTSAVAASFRGCGKVDLVRFGLG